jgi:hypothetical protein
MRSADGCERANLLGRFAGVIVQREIASCGRRLSADTFAHQRENSMIMIECEFVVAVYGFGPNDYSLSGINEEGAPAICETTV